MFSRTYRTTICLLLKQFSSINSNSSPQQAFLIGIPFVVICLVTPPKTELPKGLTVSHSPLYFGCLTVWGIRGGAQHSFLCLSDDWHLEEKIFTYILLDIFNVFGYLTK